MLLKIKKDEMTLICSIYKKYLRIKELNINYFL